MTKYQRRCNEMFVRVRGFGELFRERFQECSPGGQAFAAVRAAIAEIDALFTAKIGAVDNRQWRARERVAIVRALLSITHAARRIARHDRSVQGRFVMPSPRTDGSLLETARTFARDAAALEARFVGIGLPPTFIADLRARTDGFERAVHWRRGAQVAASAAQAGLVKAFRRAFDAVLTLDIVMANSHPDDPVMLATWKGARRIDRKRVRRTRQKAA